MRSLQRRAKAGLPTVEEVATQTVSGAMEQLTVMDPGKSESRSGIHTLEKAREGRKEGESHGKKDQRMHDDTRYEDILHFKFFSVQTFRWEVRAT